MTKTHDSNPILSAFPGLVPADGLYDVADVAVVWSDQHSDDACGRKGVFDITIQFVPSEFRQPGAAPFPIEFDAYDQQWDNSNGNCVFGWAQGSEPRATPEGLFSGWLIEGFADRDEMLRALAELGRIRQCEWARVMLAAMRAELGLNDEITEE